MTGYLKTIETAAGQTIGIIRENGQVEDCLVEEITPGGGVDSFNGRTGVVVSVAGDYNSDQVTNSSGVAGATVSDALDTLAAAVTAHDGAHSLWAADATAGFDTSPALNTYAVVQGGTWADAGGALFTRAGDVLTYVGTTGRKFILSACVSTRINQANAILSVGISVGGDLAGQATGSAADFAAGGQASNQIAANGTITIATQRLATLTNGQAIRLVGATNSGAVDMSIDRAVLTIAPVV